MNRETIEKAAQSWAKGEITKSRIERTERAFEAGAHYVLDYLCHLPLDELVVQLEEYADEKLPETGKETAQ